MRAASCIRRRHFFFDGDDPYLVVAADKGTATFSDTANAISQAKHHWLGDAFASGGSQGYDHKKMGITARGAWEAVKRHFREIDIDIQTTPSRCAASATCRATCSATACSCRRTSGSSPPSTIATSFSILSPDAERALAERKRLFDLPRSSWKDYDTSIIRRAVASTRARSRRCRSRWRCASPRSRQSRGHPFRGDERDLEGACRPSLVRRHRHLCPFRPRERCRGRRSRQ